MKSGYEAGQRHGINRFRFCEEEITIIHTGAVEYVIPGQILLLRRPDGMFWCGRAYNEAYMFLMEIAQPARVGEVFDYLHAAQRVRNAHTESNFVSQRELPF